MRSGVTPAGSVVAQRRTAKPDHPPAAPVPVRGGGQGMAPVIPQRASTWLEPLGPATILPERARRRLRAVHSAGVIPRAVVVFQELPITEATRFAAGRRRAVAVARALPPLAVMEWAKLRRVVLGVTVRSPRRAAIRALPE